ncbi:MAG: hypothetical protein N4A59_11385 [Marinifilum sp.]|nr:hypothetical protein [Marinifilum sp.]
MRKPLIYLFLLLVFTACSDDDENLQSVFRYKNDTSYSTKIIIYGDEVSVNTNNKSDTIHLAPYNKPTEMSYNCAGDFCQGDKDEPFRGLADSARIVFDNNKELFFLPGKNCSSNVLCRNAYKEYTENDNLILEFSINQKLYTKAQEIK